MAAKRKATKKSVAPKNRVAGTKAAKAAGKPAKKGGVANKSKKAAVKTAKKAVAKKTRKAVRAKPVSASRKSVKAAAPARSKSAPAAKPKKKAYELKTKETVVDVDSFLAAVDSPLRREQAKVAINMLRRVTGEEPKMWGPSIVGFGKYAYTYESGHSGEMCIAGFSPRKAQFVFYLLGHPPESDALWSRLGKYSMGKSCLYVKKFEDIDLAVLEELMTRSVEAIRDRYPTSRAA